MSQIDYSIIGKQHHDWTVLAYSHSGPSTATSKDKRTHWFCRCVCGSERVLPRPSITRGEPKSCGCRFGRIVRAANEAKRKPTINYLFRSYKESARSRGLVFALEFDVFKELVSKECIYCGEPPARRSVTLGSKQQRRSVVANGLDRIDSSKGYMFNNVVPCCTMCNLAKRDLPLSKFISWIERLTDNRDKWEIFKV